MKGFNSIWASLALLPGVIATGTDDQVNPPLARGSFANPAANYRPRFRYWVPDASINLTHFANDIADAGSKGAGGIEVLGYYLYGDVGYGGSNSAPVQVDWTEFGWGTQAWRDVQDTALQASKDNGMIVDFTIGPNQGAGVPAKYDSDGLLWDLASFNTTLTNGSFEGILPGWGTGKFVSASTGLVTSTVNTTYTFFQYESTTSRYALFSTLQADTLQDITQLVGDNGHLSFQSPSGTGAGNYTLFVYYLVHSEFRENGSPAEVEAAVPQSPVENYVQNGSWLVDHFSSTGAQVVIDFWEDHLLNGSNTKELLSEVGNYLWEDSMEYGQGVYIYWTPKLQSTFLTNRGYSVNKFLPLLFFLNTDLMTSHFYITDEADSGHSHIWDYRQTLTELYGEYLGALTNWSNSLGIQFSAQVAYNLPMDLLEDMPVVNGPEVESLGLSHNIDWYRQAAGPAHLAGKRIVSSELGAIRNSAYQQTLPEILWDIKRSIAGSVNNFILHGMPYSGDYPKTTWPSFTTFVYQFSSMHGPHEPAWDFYGDFLNWTARTQYIYQAGVPKIDLAFYLKDVDFISFSDQYVPGDLESAGFTYHYLGPESFGYPKAVVSDNVLAPDAQSFKALIVRGNDTMTLFGVQKIREYATNGLPVIFSGGVPSNVSGYQPNATAYINSTLASILSLPNVHQVAYEGLADSLTSLGITPRAGVSSDATNDWFTQWRHDSANGADYVYVYNDGSDVELGGGCSEGNVTLERTGTPVWYDTWTGEVSPVLVYSQANNKTTIPLQLKGNHTVTISFSNSSKPSTHVDSLSHQYFSTKASLLITADDPSSTVSLSNGSSLTLTPPSTTATILGPWSLTIESWHSPVDTFDLSQPAAKINLSTLTVPTLLPWSSISASLQNVSGRGYYSTNFTWSAKSTATGALLDLGVIVHTVKVWVNGAELPPLDVTWPRADLAGLLREGVNEVKILITTPLGNALRPLWAGLLTSGKVPQDTAPSVAEYGLVADVRIVPYSGVKL